MTKMTKTQPTMTSALNMKKMPPNLHSLTEQDHLPSVRRLRVQVMTNSKGYTELNLNHRGMRMVPAETFQMTTTQVLRLDHNSIDFLPMMIAYLRALRVLDLQHNVLVKLPETLVNCKHLAELRLTGNRLASLPRTFGGLRNLRILELGENQLEQLPQEIGELSSLRVLDLHSNRLWHVPFSLQELRHLMQLNLSDNMFDHVPLVVTKVTSLKALNLSRNRLGSLPLDFDALRGLRELNLSHNKLITVSSLVVTLRNLKYLSLASNSLKFLPPQMSQLQNLSVLHLQDNELRHVPFCLRKLRYYNVATNQISSFSVEGMRNLVSLTASRNRLETVPRGLYKLKNLRFLQLDNNCLVELDEAIKSLKGLRVLDLSHNNLVSLPKAIHRLPSLHSFTIKGNYKLSQSAKSSRRRQDSTYRDNDDGEHEKEANMQRFLSAKGSRGETGQGMKVTSGEVLFSHEAASEDNRKGFRNRDYRWGSDRRRSLTDLRQDSSRADVRTQSAKRSSDGRFLHQGNNHDSLGKSSWNYRSRTHHHVQKEEENQRMSQRHKALDGQKSFTGRGVALPGSVHQTLAMTPPRSVTDSMKKKGKSSESGSEKKSKFYSVKSFRDLFRRTKKSNSSRSSIDTSKNAMRSSNSMTFPISYSLDGLDHGDVKGRMNSHRGFQPNESRDATPSDGRRSRSSKVKTTKSMESDVECDKGYSDNEEVVGDRRVGYMQREDERDWKSLSHGYGSWRSRNQGLQRDWDVSSADSKGKIYVIREYDGRTNGEVIDPHKFGDRKANLRRSASSDTVTSDFSYLDYSHNIDTNEDNRNRLHSGLVYGNDRFSIHSDVGSPCPRPSSRSRWVGQWYGPDYESSMSKSEYDIQSHDYSIKEANASFATETTAPRRLGNDSRRPSPMPKGDSATDLSYQMTVPIRHAIRNANPGSTRPRSQRGQRHEMKTIRGSRQHDRFSDGSPSRVSLRSWKSDTMLNPTNPSTQHSSRKSNLRPQSRMSRRNELRNRFSSRDRLLEHAMRGFPRDYDDVIDGDDVIRSGDEFSECEDSDDEENAYLHSHLNDEDEFSGFNVKGQGQKPRAGPPSSRVSHVTDYVDAEREHSQKTARPTAGKDYRIENVLRSKSLCEFDNVMTTNRSEQEKNNQTNAKSDQNLKGHDPKTPKRWRRVDENFIVKEKTLPRSKSADSLMDNHVLHEAKSLSSAKRGVDSNQAGVKIQRIQDGGSHIARTDYTLLGVCNQIETLMNKNLLQPVIGWKGSHKFTDKVIQKTNDGMWRLGDGDGQHSQGDLNNNGNSNDGSRSHGAIHNYNRSNNENEDDLGSAKLKLDYLQPQMFTMTSLGGQFMTSEGPQVKVTVPAHAVEDKTQVTIQVLKMSPDLVSKAKRLSHFIDNIIFIGPIIYFYTCRDFTFNSPATVSFPAPRAVKGGHLLVLTIKRDNSCVPCNSAYRSGVMEATVSNWQFSAKVAVIAKARCKYKACKSVEHLLECVGATQV